MQSPDSATLGRHGYASWYSPLLRWLAAYAVVFSLSVMAILGALAYFVTEQVAHDADAVLWWQVLYLDSTTSAELPVIIERRMEESPVHSNYFGLFNAQRHYLLGDIVAIPKDLADDAHGHTVNARSFSMSEPIRMRAMLRRRPDGNYVVVARDLTSVRHVRRVMLDTVLGAGAFCLLANLLLGGYIGYRQARRLKTIRLTTLEISEGNLSKRLPVGGRDELDMMAHLVNHMLQEIERLMREVKVSCDGIAHDLRTPLSQVRSILGLAISRSPTSNDPTLHAYLETAKERTDALLLRFRAILRISEIESLQRRSGFGDAMLGQIVQQLDELYQPLAEDEGLMWHVRHDGPVDPVHGDAALLFEALSNLIGNAIKFSPRGGRVGVTLTHTPLGPIVAVEDEGPGIAKNERQAVLQRFYRGAETQHIPGSGLGLSIVVAVTTLHGFGFRIGVPENGRGTRVEVRCWPQHLSADV
ncbi:HAMP domain-containing sensor histidine kinase [Robbsia sp. KACC 23696]|uniref:HAMP domain-containing sensor histidine kinase n=1 Tax=Robbsia sp. KACC 23696 TaxID=3149231 RepID=UPI00325A6C2A